jgi:glucan phosphoethanolaminetransferase (alkaline phosphatase superfamily)
MPEFFFRRIIIDKIDQRAWCVLTLNNEQPGLLVFYSILNILSFLIPLIINLSSGIIIVLATLQSKEKLNKNVHKNNKKNITSRIDLKLIRTQILKHKHILIGPIILGVLSLPHLILTFIFVCTKLDQNSIPSLLAYLVGFLPSMVIIFAFVCPSEAYRSALFKSLKTIIPKYVQNRFSCFRN